MSINVTLARPDLSFPNFPNACEEVRKRAIEMGIKQDICIHEKSEGPASLTFLGELVLIKREGQKIPISDVRKEMLFKDCRNSVGRIWRWIQWKVGHVPEEMGWLAREVKSILYLPHNFPEETSTKLRTKEFSLRHELVHILHRDSLEDLNLTALTILAGLRWSAFGFMVFGGYCSSMSILGRIGVSVGLFSFTCVLGHLFNIHFKGRLQEKRADEEACKYLSTKQKYKAARYWMMEKCKNDLDIKGLKLPWRYLAYCINFIQECIDQHPSSLERMRFFWRSTWNSATERQKELLQKPRQFLIEEGYLS